MLRMFGEKQGCSTLTLKCPLYENADVSIVGCPIHYYVYRILAIIFIS